MHEEIIEEGSAYRSDKNGNQIYIGDQYTVISGNSKYTFYVYLPKNIKSGMTYQRGDYWPGAGVGGYSGKSYNYGEYMDISRQYTNNDDKVFIASNSCMYYDEKSSSAFEIISSYIEEKYKISIGKVNVYGYSQGGFRVFLHGVDVLKNGGSNENFVLIDPFYYSKQFDGRPLVTKDEVDLIASTDSSVFVYLYSDRVKDYLYDSKKKEYEFSQSLLTSGANIMFVSNNLSYNDGINDDPHSLSLKLMQNDGWLSFNDGLISILDINDSSDYIITIPNKDRTGWIQITLKELKEIEANYETADENSKRILCYVMWEATKINKVYIEKVNDLIGKLKDINENLLKEISYTSTSMLLSSEKSLITIIKSGISNLQNSFKNEAQNILNAGIEYSLMEKKLLDQTNNISSIVEPNTEKKDI